MSTFICDIKDVMHLLSHRLFKVSTSNVNHFLQGLRQLRYNNILVLMLEVKISFHCFFSSPHTALWALHVFLSFQIISQGRFVICNPHVQVCR